MVELCQEVEKFFSCDLFIMQENAKLYYKEDKIYPIDVPLMKTVDGIDMIRADLISEMILAEVDVTKDYAQIIYNGKTVVFNKDNDNCTSNGNSVRLEKAPFESEGYLYVPMTVVAREFSYNMRNFRGLVTVSNVGNNDLVNRISIAVATMEAFKRYDQLK